MDTAKDVKSVVTRYRNLRKKFSPELWGQLLRGELVRGHNVGTLKDKHPEEWEKWVAEKRWRIYEDLTEPDFPECVPHLKAFLDSSPFHSQKYWYNVGAGERKAARQIVDLLEVIGAERPAWDEVLSASVSQAAEDGASVRLKVLAKGEERWVYLWHSWKEGWSNPDRKANEESCRRFYASPEAEALVAQGRDKLADLRRAVLEEAKEAIRKAIAEALAKGAKPEELQHLVHEVVVDQVHAL